MPSSSSAVILNTGVITPNPSAILEQTVTTPTNQYAVNNTASSDLRLIGTVTAVMPPSKLFKVQLMATLSNNTVVTYTLPYNPETLEIVLPNKFSQYGGVTYQPRMYYSGKDANRMSIRTIVRDRVNGLMPTLNSIYQFANPDPTVKSTFATPPLTTLNYYGSGMFTGYVERPTLQINEWHNNLMPIAGYLSFTFIVVQHQIFTTNLAATSTSNTSIVTGPNAVSIA